ncbi:hypothetical protein RISK_001225 [Rhodopirellula islandica]|uniref:Uncharacterized protein n=1 Tax=Rhodopirellula islandica TaxID=595434 RepID=A0A0J1BJK7_RHOIS|nr:hypothetical protein RISK_001225 [Rhodopirellula islandica]
MEAHCTDKVRWASKPGEIKNSTLGFQARRNRTLDPSHLAFIDAKMLRSARPW